MRRIALTWGALMALLALTTMLAFMPLGKLGLPVALGIGVAKAVIVLAIFMELGRATGLVRAFAVAGLAWLFLLVGIGFTDYGTRRDVLLPRPEPGARDRGR